MLNLLDSLETNYFTHDLTIGHEINKSRLIGSAIIYRKRWELEYWETFLCDSRQATSNSRGWAVEECLHKIQRSFLRVETAEN